MKKIGPHNLKYTTRGDCFFNIEGDLLECYYEHPNDNKNFTIFRKGYKHRENAVALRNFQYCSYLICGFELKQRDH